MSTVLLLGAGASAASDYKLPTMKGFFAKEDFARGTAYKHLRGFLRGFSGGGRRMGANAFKSANLEEVLTYLDNIEHESLPLSLERRLSLRDVRPELDKYIWYRLVEQPLRVDSVKRTERVTERFKCNEHEEVFKELGRQRPDWSIVSINYDLIADGTLLGMGGPFNDACWSAIERQRVEQGFMFMPKSLADNARFFKLHGSLDYYCCANVKCLNHSRLTAFTYEHPDDSPPDNPYCEICGAPPKLAIVPPTLSKTRDDFPRIGLLWSMAHGKLKEADRWVIWGVSLAESDHMLRTLLRESAVAFREANQATSLRVDVINKVFERKDREQEEEAKRILSILRAIAGKDVHEYRRHNEWVKQQQKGS